MWNARSRSEPVSPWCGVVLLLMPALLIAIDVSVLFVAGPAIAAAMHPTSAQWLWAMDIYGFVLASLLITMGGLGDRIGRRRLLLAGSALFGAGSVAAAYAPSAGWLIGSRAVMAVGGATLAPSTLSLIGGMFVAEQQRARAVAAWSIAFAGGAIAGPIVGGALLARFWWGAVFLINVPVVVLLLVIGPFVIAEQKSPSVVRFDVIGAVLSLPAVLGLVYALTRSTGGRNGGALTIAAAGVGIAATALFIRRQHIAANPLVELSLFKVRGFGSAVGANTIVAMVTAGVGLLAFPFMQLVHGLTPLQSALCALPTIGGACTGPILASALVPRYRPDQLLIAGLFIAAGGLAIISTVHLDTPLWVFIGGYIVLTFGTGISATMGNSVVLASAPPQQAGAASGISETSSQLGAALGIALLGTLASLTYRSAYSSTTTHRDPAWKNSADVIGLAGTRHPTMTDATLGSIRHAYTSAITTAALVSALVTGLIALYLSIVLATRKSMSRQA